jgi:hypothetical protein
MFKKRRIQQAKTGATVPVLLAADLLKYIATFMDLRERFVCRGVCQLFKKNVLKKEAWCPVELRLYGNEVEAEEDPRFPTNTLEFWHNLQMSKNLPKLCRVAEIDHPFQFEFVKEHFQDSLETLYIVESSLGGHLFDSKTLQKDLEKMPCLKKLDLDLHYLKLPTPEELFTNLESCAFSSNRTLVKDTKSLKFLDMAWKTCPDLPLVGPLLERLSLRIGPSMTFSMTCDFDPKLLPRLRHLRIYMSSFPMHLIYPILGQLESLSMVLDNRGFCFSPAEVIEAHLEVDQLLRLKQLHLEIHGCLFLGNLGQFVKLLEKKPKTLKTFALEIQRPALISRSDLLLLFREHLKPLYPKVRVLPGGWSQKQPLQDTIEAPWTIDCPPLQEDAFAFYV